MFALFNRKAGFSLSINFLVLVVMGFAVLFLFLGFFSGMFGSNKAAFEEIISNEHDPSVPTSEDSITLSRDLIHSFAGSVEAIKISVYNPTTHNWTFRDAINDDMGFCALSGDNVCYVNSRSLGNKCNNGINAISNDDDCMQLDVLYGGDSVLGSTECRDEGGLLSESPEGICYIDDVNCVMYADPDCAPTEGVKVQILCSEGLDLVTKTLPRTINSGDFATFIALLNIDGSTSEGRYLCEISVIGGTVKELAKDLIVNI
jgi:hypothetical protein